MSDEIDEMEEESEGKGKKKGMFIILGLINLLILVGGIGYYVYSTSSTDDVEPPVGSEQVEVVEETSEEVSSEEKVEEVIVLAEEPIYVQIGPVVANLNGADKYQYMQLTLSIMTHSENLAAILPKFEIKIKHLLQTQVRNVPEHELVTNAGINKLTKNIQSKLNRFLKDEGIDVKYVEELFLSDVIIE